VQAAALCARLAGKHPHSDEDEVVPLVTGSVAEFYVEPMLPYVGDIDVMCHRNTELAIPRGHPPPTQLPAEFDNCVPRVAEIIDSHLPGYVYLLLRYLLTRCIDDGKYNYIEYDDGWYFTNKIYYTGDKAVSDKIHGPAWFTDEVCHPSNKSIVSYDFVQCKRCLLWPSQAADWPTRHRGYGWPDSATLDSVVSNGCDVVAVAHRQCRQHELMGKLQWRLSFSRAEIVLINSWMPLQQIVYHMLRYFVKTERLTDCADNSGQTTLSNYHIKTLMLWASEMKPRSWWTEHLNLVRICVELFQTLSVWLTDTRCPHYFINNCNLVDNSFDVASVASKLLSVDEQYLSSWFVINYIGQCAQLCQIDILRLFDDVSSSVKLQNAVSEIVRWRLNTSLHDLWWSLFQSEFFISLYLSSHSFTPRSCGYWMNELRMIDKRLSVYFLAVALLRVSRKILRNGFGDDDRPMAILSAILNCNVLSLHKAGPNTTELVEFLQMSAIEHLTTYRQLLARDFGSVATIVTTDLEALYAYKRGDYQRCLQLSIQNVHALLYADCMPEFPTFPEFIQLLDDNIVSLTALTLISNHNCRRIVNGNVCITQLILSLYLMTQCQLKLHHSVKSLAHTLHYIEVARRRPPREFALNHLTLKLIERNVLFYLNLTLKATARKVMFEMLQ